MITYRQAASADMGPAFDLAQRVFTTFSAPNNDTEAHERLQTACVHIKFQPELWLTEGRLLFVALDEHTVVGMAEAGENGQILSICVESAHRRRGIGTELLKQLVCALKLRGIETIALDASPCSLPFFRCFGFIPTGDEPKRAGSACTPMAYQPNEIWDVLDEHGNKTGRYAERGRKLAPGDYHLVVHVWKHNSRGEWLIDRRSPTRGTSIDGKWETTGGSAIAGDSSLSAALREAKEELGIVLDPQKGKLFSTIARHGNDGHTWLQDAWVFEHDCPIGDIRLQESETSDAMWASADKIRKMMANGEFLSEWFYPYFEEMVSQCLPETT